MLFAVHLRRDGRIAEIKNNFYYSIRDNVFIKKLSKTIQLPKGMDHTFDVRCFWYVIAAVQINDVKITSICAGTV